MNNSIQIQGIEATLNTIELGDGLGILKELVFTCAKDVGEKIIQEAVRRGVPFERINTGVKLFQ